MYTVRKREKLYEQIGNQEKNMNTMGIRKKILSSKRKCTYISER